MALSLGRGTYRRILLEHWLRKESDGRKGEGVRLLPWREKGASILLR